MRTVATPATGPTRGSGCDRRHPRAGGAAYDPQTSGGLIAAVDPGAVSVWPPPASSPSAPCRRTPARRAAVTVAPRGRDRDIVRHGEAIPTCPRAGAVGRRPVTSSSASTKWTGAWAGPISVGPRCSRSTAVSTRCATRRCSRGRTRAAVQAASPPGAGRWRGATPPSQERYELGWRTRSGWRRAGARGARGSRGRGAAGRKWDFVGLGGSARSASSRVTHCLSIATASILAKVTRDRLMREESRIFRLRLRLNKATVSSNTKPPQRGDDLDPPPRMGFMDHLPWGWVGVLTSGGAVLRKDGRVDCDCDGNRIDVGGVRAALMDDVRPSLRPTTITTQEAPVRRRTADHRSLFRRRLLREPRAAARRCMLCMISSVPPATRKPGTRRTTLAPRVGAPLPAVGDEPGPEQQADGVADAAQVVVSASWRSTSPARYLPALILAMSRWFVYRRPRR